MCPEDFDLATVKGKHKVSWQYPSGKVGAKTVKKGQDVCVYKGQPGVWKDGVLVGLPGNFPKNPTAQDIADLGLTRDTPVSPDLRIPQPKKGTYFEAPELADYVTPIRIVDKGVVEKTYPTAYDSEKGEYVYTSVSNPVYDVEWEYRGGRGVLETATADGIQSYKLQPNGAVTVVTQHLVSSGQDLPDGKWTVAAQSTTVPDYGQANLPQSAVQDWQFVDERDFGPWKGLSNFPTGKHSAPNMQPRMDRDGRGVFDVESGDLRNAVGPLYARSN